MGHKLARSGAMKTSILIIFTSSLSLCYGNVFDVKENEGECKGSVTLYEGSTETGVTKDENVKVSVDKIKMEGCRCFRLHDKKKGRGRSFFLGKQGEYTGEEMGLRKVRSVRRVDCESLAMPVWGVIVIVVGLVILMALVAVFGFRKYREYSAVQTEENSSANILSDNI